jgi:hypothetical protein
MSNKTFAVAGVTKSAKAGYKVRFANDMTRVKILAKTETDIQMIDLPNPMTKPELVSFLKYFFIDCFFIPFNPSCYC